MPISSPEHLPQTSAATVAEPGALLLRERRRRRVGHIVQVVHIAAVALFVVGAGAGVSVYLSRVGTRECVINVVASAPQAAEDHATHEICVERLWWPLTFQMQAETWTTDGVADGPRLEWHSNGKPWIRGSYAQGSRTGRWVEHWENGVIRFDGTYADDVLQGDESWYYRDGAPEWTVTQQAGKREGEERWYWPNGELRRQGHWLHGERQGRFLSYSVDGVLLIAADYLHGAPFSGS